MGSLGKMKKKRLLFLGISKFYNRCCSGGWCTENYMLLAPILPQKYYFPGLGVVAVVITLTLAGILINAYLFSWLISLGQSDMLSTVTIAMSKFFT